MKFAVFGDLHLGIKQDSTSWHEVALQWGERFVKTLQERNIDQVVFLGDFFNNRSTVSVNTLYVAYQFLDLFYKANIKLHMILGNHDLYYHNDPEVSGVALFSRYPNVTIYSKPTEVTFGTKKCWFIGWGYDQMQYKGDILFTHAEINVFKYNAKQGECNGGLRVSELLQNFNLVYTGHFHLRQNKKWSAGEVRYPGNPFQMDYSDECCVKGFEIYDTETEQVEFVPDHETPRFYRVKLSQMIKTDIEELKENIRNSYFKLILDMNITFHDVDVIMQLINACRPKTSGFEWENGQKFSQNIEEGEFQSFEIEDAITEFINQMDIPRKDEVSAYLLKIYKQAKGE